MNQTTQSLNEILPIKISLPAANRHLYSITNSGFSEYLLEDKEISTFRIKRVHKGINFFYQLWYNDEIIFSALAKYRHPKETIFIKADSNITKNGYHDYCISPSNNCSKFNLHLNSIDGPELMIFESFKENSDLNIPSHCEIRLKEFCNMKRAAFITKRPNQTSNGKWFLDFQHRKVIPSVKNSIFVSNERNGNKEEMSFRKISKDTIECEAKKNIQPILVFSAGLGLFLSKF